MFPQPVADDSGLGRSVDLPEGRKVLQRDLGRLAQWTKANSTKIKKGKGWVPHLGHSNPMECSKLWKGQLGKISGGEDPATFGSIPVMALDRAVFLPKQKLQCTKGSRPLSFIQVLHQCMG